MALPTRNAQIAGIAAEASRKADRVVFKAQGSGGTIQAVDAGGAVIQEENTDRFIPYGFWSIPPADTEQCRIPGDPSDAIVGERITKPSAVPSNAESGTIFSTGGGYVQCKNGGVIEAEPEAGQTVNVGATAAQYAAMANLVLTELEKIAVQIVGLGGAYVASPVACTKLKIE